MYSLVAEFDSSEVLTLSSSDIGARIGVRPHNVRKDISYIGEIGTSGSGYDISVLKKNIEDRLGLKEMRKACIIGLGPFGRVILNSPDFTENFMIVAGFDSSINRIETMKTEVPVYPTYEIESVVNNRGIELAVITEGAHTARKIVDSLISGGIRGIVNFSPIVIGCDRDDVFISNMDLIGEFRFLSALLTLNRKK